MANPETCCHNVVGARVAERLTLVVNCLSCGTDLPPEKRAGKRYKLDSDYRVWVHDPHAAPVVANGSV